MRKKFFLFYLFIFLALPFMGFSDNLNLSGGDVAIELDPSGGYHLWIKSREGLESVLITESTADPEKQEPTYALRSLEYNPINGDEQRKLNGEFLDPEKKLFSLLDSSPEVYPPMGMAFHVYIPEKVAYGYAWSRNGEIDVQNGTFLNIRTFRFPYADYDGGFIDNPFVIRLASTINRNPENTGTYEIPEEVEEPEPEAEPPVETDLYFSDTISTFYEYAEDSGGTTVYSEGPSDLVDKIDEILNNYNGNSMDLVLAIDTTESMNDDVDIVREKLTTVVEQQALSYATFRIGVVLYKDYMETYLTRIVPFVTDLSSFQNTLNRIRVNGGRDIPEAVNEALYVAASQFPWMAEDRLIILIGDAPPHPTPRGDITEEMVNSAASLSRVNINTIILPNN